MAEVTIKSHTRKSKSGKSITVKSYTRRVGRKGHISPKETKSEGAAPGEELKAKVAEKKTVRKLTPEEIAERREVMEGFKRVDSERKALGMTPEQYSRYRLKEEKKSKSNVTSSHSVTVKNPLSEKGSSQIFNRAEDKITKFVEKYGGKYKRTVK